VKLDTVRIQSAANAVLSERKRFSIMQSVSANFDFLGTQDEQLVRLGALAERYFKHRWFSGDASPIHADRKRPHCLSGRALRLALAAPDFERGPLQQSSRFSSSCGKRIGGSVDGEIV
jgi:hypothetical protein